MVVPRIETGRAMIVAVLLKACLNVHNVTCLFYTLAIERTALTGHVNGSAYVLYLTAAILRLSVHLCPPYLLRIVPGIETGRAVISVGSDKILYLK